MISNKLDKDYIYMARLHWILFVWPAVICILSLYIAINYYSLQKTGLIVAFLSIFWEFVVWLNYQCSYLIIKKKQVILCTGIFVRQTLDISLNKIESVDIRQSILGSILQYGSLVITGTGGTRQYINFLNKPLTCRRHIEQILHD